MKTTEKASAGGVLLLLLACAASPAHAAKYKIRWLLGHPNLDYFEEAAADFKKAVEAGSHGDIQIDIIKAHSDSPGDKQGHGEPEIAAAVAKGEAEMGHSFADVAGEVDHRLWSFEAPYLFRDYRHLEGVFEGPVGEHLLESLRSHQLVGLSFTYSGGASGVAALDRDLRRPEDLKGLRIGVYGDTVNAAWLRSLGATPVPIEHWQEGILRQARAGRLDAVVVTWRNFEREKLDSAFRSVGLVGSTYLVSVTYVNEAFFKSLPADYQRLLKDASHAAGLVERAKTIELNERAKRTMLAKGVRVVYPSEDDRRAFAEALRPAFDGPLAALLGKDFVATLGKVPDSAHPMMSADFAKR